MNEAAKKGQAAENEVIAYVGLGSNIHPEHNLPLAIILLERYVQVDAVSTAWKTPAAGAPGPDFLNAAAKIRTKLSAQGLKTFVLRRIEALMGRVRTQDKFAPRTIDLDILVYNGELVDPQVWEEAFLAVPLAELLSDYAQSLGGKTLAQAAQELARQKPILPVPEVLPGPLSQSTHK